MSAVHSGTATMRRVLGLLILATAIRPGPVAAQKFFPDDPLESEPTPLPAVDPGTRNLSFLLEAMSATLGTPGERQPRDGQIGAQGVNTLGESLDGAWFVNRHGRARLSLDQLRRGAGEALEPSAGPWRVLLMRSSSSRPTIIFRDAGNQMYLLRFDPPEAPELATGAEMISSRFFHALGYHVPETYLVVFDREQLVVETNASDITSFGTLRTMVPEDIDRLMASVARRSDGRYRAVALRVPIGGRVANRSVPVLRHAQRRSERHRAARAPARFEGAARLLGLAEPLADRSAPHDGHPRRAGRAAPARPPLPLRLHGDARQRPYTRQAGVGGTREHLRTGHDAPQHRQPGPLHAFLDEGDLS